LRSKPGQKQGECSADFTKKQRFAAAVLLFFVACLSGAGWESAGFPGFPRGHTTIPRIFAADSLQMQQTGLVCSI
jgi:hypothetical protein